jgi:gas vesicle protein
MTDDPDISALKAYKLTLKGIVITFVICNVLILSAVAVGFYITVKKIEETAKKANDKIDRSYEAVATYSKKVSDKLDVIGERTEVAASNVADVVTGALKETKVDVKDVKEAAKNAVLDYLKRKAEQADKAKQP